MPLTDGKDQVGRVGHSTHNHELQQRNNGHSPSFPGMRPCVPLDLQAGLAQAGISASHLAAQSSQAALQSSSYAQSIVQAAQSAMQAGLLGSQSGQPIGMPWLPLTVPALPMPVHHPVSYLPFHAGAPPNALAPPPYFVTPQTHQLNAMGLGVAPSAAAAAASATHTGASSSATNSQQSHATGQPYGPAFNLPVVPSVFMINQYLQYLFAAQHAASQAQPPLANSSPLGSASSSSSIAPSQLSPKSSCAAQNAPASSGVTTGTKHSVTTSTAGSNSYCMQLQSTPSHACTPQPTVSTFSGAPTPAATPTSAHSAAVFMPSFAFSHKPSGSVIPVGIAAQVRPSGTPQFTAASSSQPTLVGVPVSPQPAPTNGPNSATATILVPASTGTMPPSGISSVAQSSLPSSGSSSSASANTTTPSASSAGFTLPTAFMPNATVYFAMPSTVQPSQFSNGSSAATQLPQQVTAQSRSNSPSSDSSNSTAAPARPQQSNASDNTSASTPQQCEPALSAPELEQPRVPSEERLGKKRERIAATTSRKVAPIPPVSAELQPTNVPDTNAAQQPAPASTSASVSDKPQESARDASVAPVTDGDARRRRKRAKSRAKRMRFSPARRGAKRRKIIRESVPSGDEQAESSTARAELPVVSKQQHAAAAKQRKRDRDRERRHEKAAARQRGLSTTLSMENNNESKANHNEIETVVQSRSARAGDEPATRRSAHAAHDLSAERGGDMEKEHEAERFLIADSELISCENLPVLHFDAATNTYVEVRLTEMVPANLYEMRVLGDRSTQQHILTHEEVLNNCVHDYRLDLTSASASTVAEQSLALEQLLTARYTNSRIAARWHYAENRFYAGRVRRITAKRGRLPLANTMEIEVEFDDGDTGVIEPDHVRLVPSLQPPMLRTSTGSSPRRAAERDPATVPSASASIGTDSPSTGTTRGRKDSKTGRAAPSDAESLSMFKTEDNDRESPEETPALLGATVSKRRASVRSKTATVEKSDTRRQDIPAIPTKRLRGKVKDEPAARSESEPRLKSSKKAELVASEQQHTTESSALPAQRRVTRQRSVETATAIKHVPTAEGGKTATNARAAAKRTASGTTVTPQRTVEFLRVGDCVQFHTDSASALSLSGRRRRAPSSGGTSSQLPFIGRIVAIYALKQLANEPDDGGSRTPFSSTPTSLSSANSTTLFGADSSAPLSSTSSAVFGTSTSSPSSVVKLRKVSVRRAPLPAGLTTGTGTGTVALAPGVGQRDDSVTRNNSSSASQSTADGGTQQSSGHEVHVCWFYHPQEVAIPVHASILGNTHALFESNHRDRNDVATVAHRVAVRTYADFINVKPEVAAATDSYFVAGYYDPIKHILAYADDVRERLIKS